VNSLYHREGAYYYAKGINPRAVIALVLGVVIALIGLAVRPLHFLYDYAWFVGFFVAGGMYVALMRVSEARGPLSSSFGSAEADPETR
jgi:nucleobase:cation symporter-1, NCS1 family